MRVFIIGGGGSLKGFDFNRLKNEKTIAINCAFKFINPTHLLWCDPDVFGNNKDEINALDCEKYTLFDSVHPECNGCKSFRPSTLFYGNDGLTKGLYGSPHEGQWISGSLAISLAFALGYDKVYLLGYDGGDVNGLHFHPFSREEEIFTKRNYWYDAFKGLPIYNCSLKSLIYQFEKVSIGKVLGEPPIIVSFYTPEYEPKMLNMKVSAERFGFETDIVPIEKKGDWLNTIYYRAEFVRDMLHKHQRDVIWLDCDAEIKKSPELFFNFDGDFGVHFRDGHELLGGTMYFAHTPATLDLVDKWCALNKSMPKQYLSQMVLQAAVKDWKGKLVNLPPAYTQIFDSMAHYGEPVISHYQASRKFRD